MDKKDIAIIDTGETKISPTQLLSKIRNLTPLGLWYIDTNVAANAIIKKLSVKEKIGIGFGMALALVLLGGFIVLKISAILYMIYSLFK